MMEWDGGSLNWSHTRKALSDYEDTLRCWICNRVVHNAVIYVVCGHFFCGSCVAKKGNVCPLCDVSSQASEVTSDRLVNNVVGCFRTLAAIITPERSELYEENDTVMNEKHDNNFQKPEVMAQSSKAQPCCTDGGIPGSTVRDASLKSSESRKSMNLVSPTKKSENVETSSLTQTRGRGRGRRNLSKKEATQLKERKPMENKTRKISLGQKSAPEKAADAAPVKLTLEKPSPDFEVASSESSKEFLGVQNVVLPGTSKENENVEGTDCNESSTKNSRHNSGRSRSKTSKFSKTSSNLTTPAQPQKKGNTPGKELTKRNHKGETLLHVACIKGDINRVRTLLEAEANPNTKDNAGWTPLHEAAVHGFTEVAKLLLDAGAMVDVPGKDNITPLHEASLGNHVPMVRLFVASGANIYSRTSTGKTPVDLAASNDVKEALLNTEMLAKPGTNDLKSPTAEKEMVLYGALGLSTEEKSELSSLAEQLQARVVSCFGPEVTHMVVASDVKGTCTPTMEVLCAILQGMMILNRDWLKIVPPVDEEIFELNGVTDFQDTEAPKRGRLNAQKQLPRLLNGCHFFITSNTCYKSDVCELSKAQLIAIVKAGGAEVLKRQPDPEAIPLQEQTVPYHAPVSGSLARTSHFIIYSSGKGEPELKYNMTHCKTLPVEWLINCILHWQLLDP